MSLMSWAVRPMNDMLIGRESHEGAPLFLDAAVTQHAPIDPKDS